MSRLEHPGQRALGRGYGSGSIDGTIYVDLGFFRQLEQPGAQGGPLAQAYLQPGDWG